MKTWFCKIGECESSDLIAGADGPMRRAVEEAYRKVTGKDAKFLFSGWGASLTEEERAVVEDRAPVPGAGEPVGEVARNAMGSLTVQWLGKLPEPGTKLYSTPPADEKPEGGLTAVALYEMICEAAADTGWYWGPSQTADLAKHLHARLASGHHRVVGGKNLMGHGDRKDQPSSLSGEASVPTHCEWTEDSDGVWDTACGNAFMLEADSPADNDMRFCCYCGGKLSQCSYQMPDDDDESAPCGGGPKQEKP